MRGFTRLATTLLVFAAAALPALADKRVALIIGNSAYEHADKLANPVTDARNLRDTLKKIGFADENIIFGQDLTKRDMERAIGRFAILARDADVALAYYAGHGATFGDTPYIVPVDARFETVDQMPYELEPLEALVGELRKARGVRIAIVDACRDNGAERSLKKSDTRGGEITRGLARLADVDGLIVAYATQYLATAEDGPNGTDSPFTAALIKYLPTPGMDVKDVFFAVGREVLQTTKGRQRPEVKISFYEKYALVAPAAGDAVPPPAAPLLSAVVAPPPVRPEQIAFDAAMQADTPALLDGFLEKFPVGALSDIARRERDRLVKLAALPPPAPPPAPVTIVVPKLVAGDEQLAFDKAMATDSTAALDTFLAKYGSGPLADIARRERDRLIKLTALPLPVPAAPPAPITPPAAVAVPAPPPASTPPQSVTVATAPVAPLPRPAPPSPPAPAPQQGWVHAMKDTGASNKPPPTAVVPPATAPSRQFTMPEGAKLVAIVEDVITRSVAYSPDGRMLAAAKSDGSVPLWEAASGKLLFNFEGHSDEVNALSFAPDGHLLATASNDKTIRLWDVASGKQVQSIAGGYTSAITALAFAPDGKSLLAGSGLGSVVLWDVATGKQLRKFAPLSKIVTTVAFAPDGKTVAAAADKSLKLWDAATGAQTFSLAPDAPVGTLAFSPDGRMLLSASGGPTLRLWDMTSGSLIRSLAGASAFTGSAAISPDGKQIIAGLDDFSLSLADTATGKFVRKFEGHAGVIASIAFAPNGRTVLSGSAVGTLKLWDVTTGALLATYFTVGRNGVAYTPSGLFVTDADPRAAFALKRGDERLPLDDFIAVNRRQVLSKAASAQ